MEYIFQNNNNQLFHISEVIDKYFLHADKIQYKLKNKYASIGRDSFYKTSIDRSEQQDFTISYDIITSTDAQFDFCINTINSFFNPVFAPFYIIDVDNRKRMKIDYNGMDEDYSHPLRKQLTTVNLNFSVLDNFWQSMDKTKFTQYMEPGDSITISISSYLQTIPFILRLTNRSAIINDDFVIEMRNGFKIRRGFAIRESGFIQFKTIIIDSSAEDSLVKLMPNDINIKKNLIVGAPFQLYQGDNIIKYTTNTGADVFAEFEYYERYLI